MSRVYVLQFASSCLPKKPLLSDVCVSLHQQMDTVDSQLSSSSLIIQVHIILPAVCLYSTEKSTALAYKSVCD